MAISEDGGSETRGKKKIAEEWIPIGEICHSNYNDDKCAVFSVIGVMTKIVRTCSLRSGLRKSSMITMEKESSLLFLMDSLKWGMLYGAWAAFDVEYILEILDRFYHPEARF